MTYTYLMQLLLLIYKYFLDFISNLLIQLVMDNIFLLIEKIIINKTYFDHCKIKRTIFVIISLIK